MIKIIEVDKLGSATSPLSPVKTVALVAASDAPSAGDVVVVRALTDSATYNMLELPSGRLAKINPGDLLLGVLGRRRALKGFVGDVPASVKAGDHLHLLNMGGVIGYCTGHHSSLGDAIQVEVIGLAADETGRVRNIADAALPTRKYLGDTVESVFADRELRDATAAMVFCASDYVGAWGGIELLRQRGIEIDVISGSVTDSRMGEDYLEKEFGVRAANAKRNGAVLFEIVKSKLGTLVTL